MPTFPERYLWEATMPDGQTLNKGGDLSGAKMVSIIPHPEALMLPRHDFVGLPFVRRFARGFVRGMGGGMKEYVHCIVCQDFRIYIRSLDGSVLITPPDYELYL